MRVIRRPAFQGHAVPATAGYARNPFDPVVVAPPRIVFEEPAPEAVGATAQNGYRATRFFQCSDCSAVLTEDEVDAHDCEEVAWLA